MLQKEDLEFTDLLDPQFQELILGLMARDVDFLSRARPITKDRYFSSRILREGCRALFEYWDERKSLPAPDILALAVSKRAENEETRDAWTDAIRKLWELSEDDLDRPFLEKELAAFAQRAEAAVAVGQAARDLKTFDIDKLAKQLREIQDIPAAFTDVGTRVRESYHQALEADTRRAFLTGYVSLDGAMRGGLKEGELFVILAPMKRGKSLGLINIAAGLMAMGHDVTYYTLEMSRLDVLKRIVACLSDRPTNHLDELEHMKKVQEVMDALHCYTEADITVKRYPALKHSVFDLEAHYEMMMADHRKRKRVDAHGEPLPTVPVIDYATLLKPGTEQRQHGNEVKTWIDYPTIMVQLREMGIRFRVPIITAHQSNADGLREQKQNESYIAGAKAIGAHVDYMFGIDQSEEDYAVNRFSMTPFLSRNTRKDATTYWRAIYEHSKIEEIDQETYDRMRPDDPEDDGGNRPRRRAPGGRQR